MVLRLVTIVCLFEVYISVHLIPFIECLDLIVVKASPFEIKFFSGVVAQITLLVYICTALGGHFCPILCFLEQDTFLKISMFNFN